MNLGKTKVMASGEQIKEPVKHCDHPCGVCVKSVGGSSIQCTRCEKWVHRRCMGEKKNKKQGRKRKVKKKSIPKTNAGFKCGQCEMVRAATNAGGAAATAGDAVDAARGAVVVFETKDIGSCQVKKNSPSLQILLETVFCVCGQGCNLITGASAFPKACLVRVKNS